MPQQNKLASMQDLQAVCLLSELLYLRLPLPAGLLTAMAAQQQQSSGAQDIEPTVQKCGT